LDDELVMLSAIALTTIFGIGWAVLIALSWAALAAWPVMLVLGVAHGWATSVPAASYGQTFVLLIALRLVVLLLTGSGVTTSLKTDA
jgi:hypothetical protein